MSRPTPWPRDPVGGPGAGGDAPIDAVYTVPVSDLGRWAGAGELQVALDRPVAADVNGHTQMVEDGDTVAIADLPAIFADSGTDRLDSTALQVALVKSALEAAALRPAGERAALAGVSPSPQAGPALSEVLGRITAGSAVVEQFPARTRVAEGQFAFVPDAQEIQAGITRRAPAYHSDVTVQVLNGSGRIGVGEAVVERLASLDVNLPKPLNADSFSYQATPLMAGADTLQVARDIRAILGRGVVLDGPDLPTGPSRSSSATTSRHRTPARRTSSSRSPRAHDLRAPGPRHRRAAPPARRRRTPSSSAWTRPCRTPTTS